MTALTRFRFLPRREEGRAIRLRADHHLTFVQTDHRFTLSYLRWLISQVSFGAHSRPIELRILALIQSCRIAERDLALFREILFRRHFDSYNYFN